MAVFYTDIIQPLSFICVRASFNHCYNGNLPSSFLRGDTATHQLAVSEKPTLTISSRDCDGLGFVAK